MSKKSLYINGVELLEHKDKYKKPFKVGQLIKSNYENDGEYLHGLSLVLDLVWQNGRQEWFLHSIHQRTGFLHYTSSCHYAAIEKVR